MTPADRALRAQLREMIVDGCRRPDIARELGVHLRTVGRWLQRCALRTPHGVRQVELRSRVLNLIGLGVDHNAALQRATGRRCQAIYRITTDLIACGLIAYAGPRSRLERGRFAPRRFVVLVT